MTPVLVALRTKLALLAGLLVLGSCSRPQASTVHAPEPAAMTSALPERLAHHAPVRITWNALGVPTVRVPLALVARVEYLSTVPAPLEITLRLPAGTTLLRGSTRWVLPPSSPGSIHDTELLLAFATLPTDDLVLVVTLEREGYGLHAEVPYRFGRPEPRRPVPVAEGPSVRLGGRNLGPSVPLRGVAGPGPSREALGPW